MKYENKLDETTEYNCLLFPFHLTFLFYCKFWQSLEEYFFMFSADMDISRIHVQSHEEAELLRASVEKTYLPGIVFFVCQQRILG